MGRKQFSNEVSITAGSSVVNNQSISLKVSVTTTSIDLKVGASPLVGRKSLYIEAESTNSDSVLIGVGNITLSDTNAMMKLAPSSARQIEIDGDTVVRVQAKAVTGTCILRITELT